METWTATQADLKSKSIHERTQYLPKHLIHILDLAIKLGLNPKKIWLYGSRARGDARENSDFDLAFLVRDKKNRASLNCRYMMSPQPFLCMI